MPKANTTKDVVTKSVSTKKGKKSPVGSKEKSKKIVKGGTKKAGERVVAPKKKATPKVEETPIDTPTKVYKTRPRPTIQEHIAHYDALLALIDAEIDRRGREKEKGSRPFRKARKMVVQMRKELPYIAKSKLAKIKRKSSVSGLKKPLPISEELRTFLKLKPGEKISRIEASRAICAYSHIKPDEDREQMLRWSYLNPGGKRDLQDPDNRKTIVPDKTLNKLLRYDRYRSQVEKGLVVKRVKDPAGGGKIDQKMVDPALFYWSIQKLINHHFLRDVAIEEVAVSDDVEEETPVEDVDPDEDEQ